MKFSEQYPDAKPGDVIELPGESILRMERTDKCFMCKQKAQFASFSFEGPVCSAECLDAAWDDFEPLTELEGEKA